MTELQIPYPPASENEHLDIWLQQVTEYLRDYLVSSTDRGDPSAVDFDIDDLTCDGTWNDLDLSSIIPVDTIFVFLGVGIRDVGSAGAEFKFRKNGNSNAINISTISTQAANVPIYGDKIIAVDSSRVIEYNAAASFSSGAGDVIDITVKGYLK